MKTKIITFLMIVSFFAASVAFADETPNSKADNTNPNYLGPPDEAPRANILELHIKKFFDDFFDLPWETINPKQDFYLDPPDRN